MAQRIAPSGGGWVQRPENRKKKTDPVPQKKPAEQTWLNKGLLADGRQRGDVTRTALATVDDVSGDFLAGILGMGEAAVDAAAWLSPALRQYNPDLRFDIGQYRQDSGKAAAFIQKDLYDEDAAARNALAALKAGGYVNGNVVTINMQSAGALNTLVGHEITHVLEGTELYTELQKAAFDYARSKGELPARWRSVKNRYKNADNMAVNQELTADLIGDYVFSDTDFVSSLYAGDRTVFEKVYDEVKYLCKVVSADSKEGRQLEKVKKAFADAYRMESKLQKDTKYSLTEAFTDSNGNHFKNAVLLDTNFFDGTPPRKWGEKLRAMVKGRASEDPFILPITDENGNTVLLQFAKPTDRVKKDGGANHKVLDELSSTSDNISKLAVVHIDEIVSVSEENSPYYTNENKHQWLDKNGWLHRNANVINKKMATSTISQ